MQTSSIESFRIKHLIAKRETGRISNGSLSKVYVRSSTFWWPRQCSHILITKGWLRTKLAGDNDSWLESPRWGSTQDGHTQQGLKLPFCVTCVTLCAHITRLFRFTSAALPHPSASSSPRADALSACLPRFHIGPRVQCAGDPKGGRCRLRYSEPRSFLPVKAEEEVVTAVKRKRGTR